MVLKLLEGAGNASVDDIVSLSDGDLSSDNVRMELYRLFRQGLVSRSKNGRAYFYNINARGIEKIAFYETEGI
jgi:predicted transcriptional regulator